LMEWDTDINFKLSSDIELWCHILFFLFGTVTLHCRLDYLFNNLSYARPPQFLHCAPVYMLEGIRFRS
jgi:hypothetical protein